MSATLDLADIGAAPMPPEMFRAIRQHLGLNQHQMARLLVYRQTHAYGHTHVSRLENGHYHIPGRVKLLMLAYAGGWRPPNYDKLVNGEQEEIP